MVSETHSFSQEGKLEMVDTFRDENDTFSVFKEALPDGRQHLYFVNSEKELSRDQRMSRGVMSIGYRTYGNEALLLGFKVPKEFRGRKLGQKLVNYFIQFTKNQGLIFVGTGKINKPMIALTLSRLGFVPDSRDVLVEILPQSIETKDERVPDVQIVKNTHHEKLVSGSLGGRFFRIISSDEVLKKYPISGSESVVAIQTPYTLPEEREK